MIFALGDSLQMMEGDIYLRVGQHFSILPKPKGSTLSLGDINRIDNMIMLTTYLHVELGAFRFVL